MAAGFGRAFAIVGKQGVAMRSAMSQNIMDDVPNDEVIDLIAVMRPASDFGGGIFSLPD